MSYVNKFLQLKCAGDVLLATSPITNAEKEITEAMAMISRLRRITLKDPMRYTLVDLCSGNALIPIIAVYLLPVKKAVAVDKNPRRRRGHARVRRFEYHELDILSPEVFDLFKSCDDPIILTACHPCKELAWRVVEIYLKEPRVEHLILMPCCVGKRTNKFPYVVEEKLGRYLSWAYDLSLRVNGNVHTDLRCLSPMNAIVMAEKKVG